MMRTMIAAVIGLFLATSAAAACDGRLLEGDAWLDGPVCVPMEAKRIAVLDPTYTLGMAIEVGAPVAGAPMFGMSDTALAEKAASLGVTDLGPITEPSIEKLIALQPDLIIGSAQWAASYHEMLSQLAPTVLITKTAWRDYAAAVATAVGREDKMAKLFAGFDERVAVLRDKITDKPVSIVRITIWDFQVNLDGPEAYAPFAILGEVGVKRSAYETSTTETLKRPDWEDLHQLDGDILLYIVGGANDSDKNGRHEEVLGNPLWQELPAVTAGRVHRVDAGTWMEFSGIDSANRVLDDVERYLLATDDAN